MAIKLITAKKKKIKQKGNKTEVHCVVKEGDMEDVMEFNPETGLDELIRKFVAKENISELFLYLDRSPSDTVYIDSCISSAMNELKTQDQEII